MKSVNSTTLHSLAAYVIGFGRSFHEESLYWNLPRYILNAMTSEESSFSLTTVEEDVTMILSLA